MARKKPCRLKSGRFTKCKGGTKRGKAKKRTVTISEVYFDGTKCRDKHGAFVPVAQCRRKKVPF